MTKVDGHNPARFASGPSRWLTRDEELTCREVVELVTDYLEGALTAHEPARFEQHLSSCDACDRHVNQMRVTIETVQRLPRESMPARTRDELVDEFRRWKRS